MVDDGLLDGMRQIGDPLADAAVAEAVGSGGLPRLNELLVSLRRNEESLPANLTPALREYFTESLELPDWADLAAMGRADDLWRRYGTHLSTILHAYSLPVRYGCATAAWVRYRATRMPRAIETAGFLRDVLADDGLLAPDGHGRRVVQRVRMRHAIVRHHLRSADDWDGAEPAVNQEDLTAVMGGLSVCLPRGLAALGIDVPTLDRDDLFHLWSVVGHLLGVDARLMPSSFEEGGRLVDRIWRRQWAPSEAGTALTASLVVAMRKVFGPGLRGAPPTLIRHFCGDELADLLGVPPSAWTALALDASTGLSAAYGKTGDRGELLARVSAKAGELLLAVDPPAEIRVRAR